MLLPNKEDIKHVATKGHVVGSKKGQLGFIVVEEPEEQQPLKQHGTSESFFPPNRAILEHFCCSGLVWFCTKVEGKQMKVAR